MSERKPHRHLAGYACERKHPAGGHLVVFEAGRAGIDAGDSTEGKPYRWVVVWEGAPGFARIGPGFSSQRGARAFIRYEAGGVRSYAWGDLYSDGSQGEA